MLTNLDDLEQTIRWLPPAPDEHRYGFIPERPVWSHEPGLLRLIAHPEVWFVLPPDSTTVLKLDRYVEARSDYAYVMSATRETIRVDGQATCPHCGRPYYDHENVTAKGFDSFYKGCGGEILKT